VSIESDLKRMVRRIVDERLDVVLGPAESKNPNWSRAYAQRIARERWAKDKERRDGEAA
jgi:3-deoxy-D-arabino-heptulosonate 7-phosphate (DAHP) synthase